MPKFTDPASSRPATVDQLANVPTNAARMGGRVVRLTNESYTVEASSDAVLVLAATTSTGNYVITIDRNTMADGQRIDFVIPAVFSGSDDFEVEDEAGNAIFTMAGAAAGLDQVVFVTDENALIN